MCLISISIFVSMKGKVVKSTGKHYTIKTSDGKLIKCFLKGNFRIKDIRSTNPVVVGDNVVLKKESDRWVIVELDERKNYIIRKSVKLSKQIHVIAANIDQAILIITLKSPITSTGFIDRFLVAAKAYGVEVILCFNKLDLLDDELQVKQKSLQKMYENIGYSCISTSLIKDDISAIKSFMQGKVNIISGHSGVGKSTLINKLQPDLNLNTVEISKAHQQGQHTTTFSELYDLDFGASVIDTPGIKGFGLVEFSVNEIGNYFPEFISLKQDCKFYNCIHKDEPDCAIKFAVENNVVDKNRYKNYLSMIVSESNNFRTNKY